MSSNFGRIFICVLAFVFISGCELFAEPMPKSWKWGMKPRPLTGVKNFPSPETDYGKGFQDGCIAAWDTVASGALSDLTPTIDAHKFGTSSDYSTGWYEGLEQCTYILDWDVT